eukprot:18702_1
MSSWVIYPVTTADNSTAQITTNDAICFRDPNFYHYSNSEEAFCEQLLWSKEYLNMVSSIIIGLLGVYQLIWDNHRILVIRFISGLLICCSVASFLNHYYTTRSFLLLEHFTMHLIQYIILSIIIEKYSANVRILFHKAGKYKGEMNDTKSQMLTGLNWTFSTFCIYALLYRDISGCTWGTWVYKVGHLFPCCLLLLLVFSVKILDNKYNIKVGTVCHSRGIAKRAFEYFQRGASLMFGGVFSWILIQTTCTPTSGIQYIPGHFLFHVLFGYSVILLSQYYIFILNDNNGDRMIQSPKRSVWLNAVFPYFMSIRNLSQESQKMLKGDEQILSQIVGAAGSPSPRARPPGLREQIKAVNRPQSPTDFDVVYDPRMSDVESPITPPDTDHHLPHPLRRVHSLSDAQEEDDGFVSL